MCYHMDKKRIVNFCTRAVASIHARLVCSGGDPLATSDPVLTDHFAWAIKVSSVTHGGPSDSGACTARPSCSRPGKCGTARPRCGSVTERAPASGSARCDFWASRCVTVARFAGRSASANAWTNEESSTSALPSAEATATWNKNTSRDRQRLHGISCNPRGNELRGRCWTLTSWCTCCSHTIFSKFSVVDNPR